MTANGLEVVAASISTSPSSTRNIALACIIAGTVLFVAFVAYKMQRRVRGCGCCGSLREGEDRETEAVLACAAELYQAAKDDPHFRVRLKAPPGWRRTSSPYSVPFLPPPGSTQAGDSLPGSHQPRTAAAPPWSRVSAGTQTCRPLSPLQPTSSARAAAAVPAAQQRQRRSPSSHHDRPWPRVRELVHAWTSFGGSREPDAHAAAAAAVAAAGGDDVEAQHRRALWQAPQEQQACPGSPEAARALTWSQLGLTPLASLLSSRRPSENAALPLPAWRLSPLPTPAAEVHANPIFAAYDWAAPSAAEGIEAGASMGGSSFSQGVRRTLSRLGRAASLADHAEGHASAAAAAAAQEGNGHGGREGSGHHSPGHSRRGSMLHAAASGWGEQQRGLPTRPSEQPLLHLDLQRINE